MTALYIITAYRYGMRDAHSYVVAATHDLEEAKQAAESECDYRGGKYGCEVVEIELGPWNKDRKAKQVYYVESPYHGMIGHGEHPADTTTDGWKEKLHVAMKAGQEERNRRIAEFKAPSTAEPAS